MVHIGEADGMICGMVGQYQTHFKSVHDIIGLRPEVRTAATVEALILPNGVFFIADTQVNAQPTADQIVETTLMAADEMRLFGLEPKAALLSHSNFGSHQDEMAQRMRDALHMIRARAPSLEIEGEMQPDYALSEEARDRIFPDSILSGQANLLIMPTMASAVIAMNMTKILSEGLSVGPILMGMAKPAHVLTPSVTARGLVNMAALTVVEAQTAEALRLQQALVNVAAAS
jgi:malate dehydrogenase (oxaloacetate-decarboxylating)(NADP+)